MPIEVNGCKPFDNAFQIGVINRNTGIFPRLILVISLALLRSIHHNSKLVFCHVDHLHNFRFVAQFLYSNYTIKLVNNSTATLEYMRKVRTVFCPDFLAQYKSIPLSQLPLPVPCKRSSAAPIPFGFQLSVARSRRFALPVTARSAPCGFVPLRQSRRNTVLRTPSYRAECLFFCFTVQSPFSARKRTSYPPFQARAA